MKAHPWDYELPICESVCEVGAPDGPIGFECTRPKNHAGSHMANGGNLVAIWDDDLAIRVHDDNWWERREVTKTFTTTEWVQA